MRENPFQSEKFLSFYSCTRNAGLFDLLCKNCCSLLGLLNLLYSCEIRKASVLWAALRCQSRNSCRSREGSRVFFGWSRIPNNTGRRSRIFFLNPTADVQLDHFLHHTPELGIPVEMVQFLLKPLLKQISFSSPRFPLISSAKFHSIVLKSRCRESDIFAPIPQPWLWVY